MLRAKAVVFDLFGTLTKSVSRAFSDRQLADMAAALGADVSAFTDVWNGAFDERVTGVFPSLRANLEYIAAKLAIRAGGGALDRAVEVRETATRFLLNRLREDAIPTLRRLKSKGIRLGLISDSTPEVPAIWQETALAGYFDSVIFSDVVKIKKPDPKIYLKMCAGLDCPPAQCVYVGDGGSGELTGAEKVGMFPILICPTTDEELFQPSKDEWRKTRIATLADVLRYVT
jgi:putative hydrolase of the HAD superfamily